MTYRLKVTYETHADGPDTLGLEEGVGHHCSMSEPYAGCHECDRIRIRSANWHITTRCNYRCRFCFSRKLDAEIRNLRSAEEILKKLASLGIEKINFAGGEPLLHPLLFPIVRMAKDMAFAVSIISNGYYLNRDTISKLSPCVDWIGLSVDSVYEQVEVALGRGNGSHVRHITAISDIVHEVGAKLKINTTVTRMNYAENICPLLSKLKPERWKAFQVLHIAGQNDRYFNELSITDREFDYFKSVNQGCVEDTEAVFERNQDMIDSYFMLSPKGMVISNRNGSYSLIPLGTIDEQKLSQLLDVSKYAKRRGIYSW